MSNSVSSNIRFLHAVGPSTLRQGITVPRMEQTSWLGEIKKGESIPVTIVFGQGQTVLAVLRRLNNACGHLQFRYESRKQATLRNYLCQEFGNRSDCRNAVLRVVETGPHTFLFEPVSVGHKQAPSLSLYRPYFHNLSEEYARETYEFSELQRCLTSIDYDENYSQIDYNALISRNLRQTGWKQEVRIVKEIGLRCDFEKNGIWLEVEFGNARVYYQNYIKFLLALRYQEARFGILLCPTNAFAQLLCDLGQRRAALKRKSSTECRPTYSGMMSYEKAIRELPFLKFIFTGRILIGGIEIQALPHSA